MSFFSHYILVDKKPVAEIDSIKWAKWFKNIDNRRVAETNIESIRVSTVFLGIDHNFGDKGPPVLFETMIFGGIEDEYQTRCCTWEQAEAMHAKAVQLVMKDFTNNLVEDFSAENLGGKSIRREDAIVEAEDESD